MGANKQWKAVSRSDARSRKSVITRGEAFPDGTIIELVSGPAGSNKPDLLLWNGTAGTVASRVQQGEHTYEAPELAPSLYRAIRLPAKCTDYGSLQHLFSGIAELFNRYLGFSDRESRLLTAFSISTWLADRLPTAPGVVISALDEGMGIGVLRLLSCLCRRPIMLAEVTPGSFRSLPMYLSPTLLIDQHGLRPNIQKLFRASNYRGLHFPCAGGKVVDLYGAKAILFGDGAAIDTVAEEVIQISVTPSQSQWPTFDEGVQNEIAADFQPRLLHYRLKKLASVCESQVDVPEFTLPTRRLAAALGACLAEDAELAQITVRLLESQDEDIREQRFRDVDLVVVEILWSLLHHKTQKAVRVEELAKDVNALLRSRGETLIYSAEEVGWVLRRLGIGRHTSRAGRQVLLSGDNSRTVHRAALGYDLPLSQGVMPECPFCSPWQVIGSKELA